MTSGIDLLEEPDYQTPKKAQTVSQINIILDELELLMEQDESKKLKEDDLFPYASREVKVTISPEAKSSNIPTWRPSKNEKGGMSRRGARKGESTMMNVATTHSIKNIPTPMEEEDEDYLILLEDIIQSTANKSKLPAMELEPTDHEILAMLDNFDDSFVENPHSSANSAPTSNNPSTLTNGHPFLSTITGTFHSLPSPFLPSFFLSSSP